MKSVRSSRRQQLEGVLATMHALKRRLLVGGPHMTEALPVTPSQWAVLGIVMEKKQVGLKEIAQNLGISSSAATQLVEGLVEKGFLLRAEDKTDRRALVLTISKKYQKKMLKLKDNALCRLTHIFAALNDKELTTYAVLNKKIFDHITNDYV